MTLTELADRCERAIGPDRELDALIACASRWPPIGRMVRHWVNEQDFVPAELEGYIKFANLPDNDSTFKVPEFTASIDAALMLVPEGYDWAVTNIRGGDYEQRDRSSSSAALCDTKGERVYSNAQTPALALCAAALRAISKGEG